MNMLLTLYIAFIVLLVLCFAWASADHDVLAWTLAVILSFVLALNSYNIIENYTVVQNSTTVQNGTSYLTSYNNDVVQEVNQDSSLFYFWFGVSGISLVAGAITLWDNIQKKRGKFI